MKKATLIMKNGMSIELNDPVELLLGDEIYTNRLDELLVRLSLLDDDTIVELTHKIIHEGKVHVFDYTFRGGAYNWGYVHTEETHG